MLWHFVLILSQMPYPDVNEICLSKNCVYVLLPVVSSMTNNNFFTLYKYKVKLTMIY